MNEDSRFATGVRKPGGGGADEANSHNPGERNEIMTRFFRSVRRVRVIAFNTVREATRQRVLWLISLLALALVASVQWLSDFNFGTSETKFVADFGFGAMAFFGAALTIVATSQLFFSEMDQRTIFTLLAKPVGRAEFVVGKYLGAAVITGIFCAALTTALVGVLLQRELSLHGNLFRVLPSAGSVSISAVCAAAFAQWLKLLVLSVFTLLVASFARSQLFATGIGFLILVCGHLQFILQNTAERGGGLMTRVAAFVVRHTVPDFQLFDLSSAIDGSESGEWLQLGRLTIYAAMYLFAAGVLAVTAFQRREL